MAFGKFGRYYPGGGDVRIERFDLVALVREQVAALGEPRIGLRSEQAEWQIESDRQHVLYIVVNLLQNAVKYSPPESLVDVELESAGDAVLLRVRDAGIGIPAAELEQLFSPFYRASNVGATPGTGMGLAIVKKSSNLVGARLDVSSQPGSGTTFSVVFPTART